MSHWARSSRFAFTTPSLAPTGSACLRTRNRRIDTGREMAQCRRRRRRHVINTATAAISGSAHASSSSSLVFNEQQMGVGFCDALIFTGAMIGGRGWCCNPPKSLPSPLFGRGRYSTGAVRAGSILSDDRDEEVSQVNRTPNPLSADVAQSRLTHCHLEFCRLMLPTLRSRRKSSSELYASRDFRQDNCRNSMWRRKAAKLQKEKKQRKIELL